MRNRLNLFLFGLALPLASCGYALQTSRSPLLEREGVRKVFVEPLTNNSYKPGVENLVYNALIRTLSSYKRVVLVSQREEADAILTGNVSGAGYAPSALAGVGGLNPAGLAAERSIPTKDFSVASEYSASLSCAFALTRRNPQPGQRGALWASTFTRTSPFPALNQLDVVGTTSALINESEFDRALRNMANSMMADLHESMLAMF